MQPFVIGIQKLLKQKLNISVSSLTPETDFQKDLDLVDWEMLYLLNAIEKKWHVSITPNDSENIHSMEQLMMAVRKKGKIY